MISQVTAPPEYQETLDWLKHSDNDYQQSCDNILYYPETDLLAAQCSDKNSHRRKNHFSVLPHASLFQDKGVRIRNFEGVLTAEHCKEGECFRFDNHKAIRDFCESQGLKTIAVGQHLTCSVKNQPKPVISNCDPVEYSYNNEADLMLVKCRGSNDVFYFHNSYECMKHKLELAIITDKQEKSSMPITILLAYGCPHLWIIWLMGDFRKPVPAKRLSCIVPGQLIDHRRLL